MKSTQFQGKVSITNTSAEARVEFHRIDEKSLYVFSNLEPRNINVRLFLSSKGEWKKVNVDLDLMRLCYEGDGIWKIPYTPQNQDRLSYMRLFHTNSLKLAEKAKSLAD